LPAVLGQLGSSEAVCGADANLSGAVDAVDIDATIERTFGL
jgi:hypothetical protein